MSDIIQVKRGSAALATSTNPILAEGEFGYETDTRRLKVGDGSTAYNDLPYFSGLTPILAIEYVIDGGDADILPGVKGDLKIPFDCTILRATLVARQTGSIVIDIWKGTYGTYPPVVAGSITAAAKPTLASANKYTDATLTGWDVDIAAGDFLGYNVDSASGIKWVNVILDIIKFN